MATKRVPAPRNLGDIGRFLWRSIAKQWADDGLEPDARELRLLEDACDEADTLAVLKAALATEIAEGRLIVKGSTGQPTTTSLVAECRRSRAQVAQLLLKLGMDDPAEITSQAGGSGMTAAEAGRLGGIARRRQHG